MLRDVAEGAPAPERGRCAFCRQVGKLTREHMIPWWADAGEDEGSTTTWYLRESGGPQREVRRDARPGQPRDLQAKAPCAACNNGWMNKLDNDMATLGPQLLRGKPLVLTKGKQSMLAAWSVKLILMLQLTHARDRLVIPAEDYTRFFDERQPSDLMQIWAGYMEPPGKHGGPGVVFGDFSHDEMIYDEPILAAIGQDASLASMGYVVTVRLGHLVIGLLRAGHADLLPFHVLASPRHWTPIWPARGHRKWPSLPLTPVVGIGPLPVWLRAAEADSDRA